MAFILYLIVGLMLLGLAIKLIHASAKAIWVVLQIGIALVVGIPVGLAYAAERALRSIRCRFAGSLAAPLVFGLVTMVHLGTLSEQPDNPAIQITTATFGASALLSLLMLVTHRRRFAAQKLAEPSSFFQQQDITFFRVYFSAFFLDSLAALFISGPIMRLSIYFWFVGYAYLSFAVLAQIYLVLTEHRMCSRIKRVHIAFTGCNKINGPAFLAQLIKSRGISKARNEAIYQSVVVKLLSEGRIVEMQLGGTTWFFGAEWFKRESAAVDNYIASLDRHSYDAAQRLVQTHLSLNTEEAADYIDQHLPSATVYAFPEGPYIVHQLHARLVRTCASCGTATSANDDQFRNGDWFCTEICRETEVICETIHATPTERFYADAATTGLVLVAGGQAWNDNHRFLAADGQGHGVAAERANHMADWLLGKSATLLGDDNAKDGADRMVNGRLIQTKYYNTAQGSVDSAFAADTNAYRYVDHKTGALMQLEVPKDQYPAAVKALQKKIDSGKVPNVPQGTKAEDLLVEGHVTYEQARNIVKFGTFESLAFDAYEGAIVGLGAGGISFGVTACIFYLNTKDAKQAARVAAVQAARTFGKTVTVYVGAQQLHRLAGVQNLLSAVDARSFSPAVGNFLESGMGVTGRNALSKALRGTIVTSIVVIAVTTGPDLIRMIRGRMSQAQFLKNLAVVSSSVAGGVIGSLVGGAAGAMVGPVGAFVGRTLGGIAGGMAAAAISSKVAGALMEDDRKKMLAVLQSHIEYLARTFILTAEEIEAVRANLDQSLTSKSLELLHAAPNRRAFANSLIKPVVVTAVKQRPAANFTLDDALLACEELAA
ncbi:MULTISPECIES: hypothetical protein [unclassified Caballeronia]|uniref:hypothetical protein n=1 Tax=unclassified Caballeronia TaxID=2646786 RepID=UPI002028F720|nr:MULTISPECIES: hypothetical protein [unclassified Caballeronia]